MNSGNSSDSLPNPTKAYARCAKDRQRPYRLPGAVVEQWRTRNGICHGPYFFRVWWDGGRQHKRYVRPADLEETRAACAAWRERQRLSDKRRADLDASDDERDRRALAHARELAAMPPALALSLLHVERLYGDPSTGRDVAPLYAMGGLVASVTTTDVWPLRRALPVDYC